jgi:hypothetical protein
MQLRAGPVSSPPIGTKTPTPILREGNSSEWPMDSSYARFREVRFFGSLDGLRALSIIGVI